jgi:hypothetical protein
MRQASLKVDFHSPFQMISQNITFSLRIAATCAATCVIFTASCTTPPPTIQLYSGSARANSQIAWLSIEDKHQVTIDGKAIQSGGARGRQIALLPGPHSVVATIAPRVVIRGTGIILSTQPKGSSVATFNAAPGRNYILYWDLSEIQKSPDSIAILPEFSAAAQLRIEEWRPKTDEAHPTGIAIDRYRAQKQIAPNKTIAF